MRVKYRWIDLFYRIATGSKKVRNVMTPVGAIIFGLFTALFVVAALQIDKWLNLPRLFIFPLNVIISLPFFSAALFLIGWSVFNFHKVKGTPVPFNPPPSLVTTGPYAFVRNPMLSGVFALLFGLGISFGSVCVIFVFTPLFILINVWEIKAIEEPELAKRLGDDYVEYRKNTPMFFPNFKMKQNNQQSEN
jgi:protein-S-isoprenylcysteine O-methyltransferase Ste14